MGKILVAGLVNLETTVKIDSFPIPYFPVKYPFFGINTTIGGVGYNISKALSVLGDNVDFLSIIGNDFIGKTIKERLKLDLIYDRYVVNSLKNTANSVILYDKKGRRQIYCDLKELQETVYPIEYFETAIKECSMSILCNINFCRPFLERAKKYKKDIATDIHVISDIKDEYNKDFMETANILFMSDEGLPCSPEEWAKKLINTYGTEIIVIGLGEKGVLLSVKKDNFIERISAVKTREVVNTVGAGDALFSCFVHFYNRNKDPYDAIKKAIIFASYKIGSTNASDGFLTEKEVVKLYSEIYSEVR
ncbi:MAG TPA: carbohydrate kinase family protein [Spirochaetota bacterium]|nr:carbohydrate kinase family protein [Spirochaetota bacterium]HOL57122.1 carbohydrate kinase family protein [Spirochaetota bacterium]HPP04731.1 carbohydrate kinase family protein [Spirochaetota bacterium]